MTDHLSGRRRPCPAGFVGMLGIVLVAEIGLAAAGRGLGSFDAAVWKRTAREAGGRAVAEAEVLCFGDSMVKNGVVPAAIEARLDLAAYNLAASGLSPPGSYFLLRRALEAGARPRAVIFDANEAQLWATVPREGVEAWAHLLGPADAFELARDDGDLGFFGLFLVRYLVPSARLRHDIRSAVAEMLAGRPPVPVISPVRLADRQHDVNRGAVLYRTVHSADGPDHRPDGVLGPEEAALWYTPGWTPRASSRLYVDRFLDLARSRGIPVFLLVPPIHPGVVAARERHGLHLTYDAFLRDVAARHPDVVVIDGRHSGYEHGCFLDAFHLNVDGALAMTEALAGLIAARLDDLAAGSRWVALPPHARPTARLGVEDANESVEAITLQDDVRRWLAGWKAQRPLGSPGLERRVVHQVPGPGVR